MPILTILLDSNEYIFGLKDIYSSSNRLLSILSSFNVKVPRFILDELHDNLSDILLKELYQLIKTTGVEIIEEKVSIRLVEKYQKQLPVEDAIIAAYSEFLKVEVLVSENRHFLVDFRPKAFKVLSSKEFIEQYFLS